MYITLTWVFHLHSFVHHIGLDILVQSTLWQTTLFYLVLHAMSLNMIAVHLSTIWQLPINVFKRQTWLTFTFVNMTGGMNESTSLVKGRKSDTDLVLSVYVLHCLGSLCSKKIIYFSCYLHFLVCCFSQPPHIPTIVIIIIIIISVSKFCF